MQLYHDATRDFSVGDAAEIVNSEYRQFSKYRKLQPPPRAARISVRELIVFSIIGYLNQDKHMPLEELSEFDFKPVFDICKGYTASELAEKALWVHKHEKRFSLRGKNDRDFPILHEVVRVDFEKLIDQLLLNCIVNRAKGDDPFLDGLTMLVKSERLRKVAFLSGELSNY